jgi:hypothetical protein
VTWGTGRLQGTGVSADFAATTAAVDNLIDLMGLLKNDYLANAKWYTRRSVITKMRKFKDTTGSRSGPELRRRLLRDDLRLSDRADGGHLGARRELLLARLR